MPMIGSSKSVNLVHSTEGRSVGVGSLGGLTRGVSRPSRCQIRASGIAPRPALLRRSEAAQSRIGRRSEAQVSALKTRRPRQGALPGLRNGLRAPGIHGAVCHRGGRTVICAALADLEGTSDVRALLDAEIESTKDLVTGQLDNGLRYVIMPNKLPPERFEAHMEIHAGSVDELPNEQGISHLVEHVTFLGSRKREDLIGTGSRANAYTDFHHTVFHVHAPLLNNITKRPMLPQVLDALDEIAFGAVFDRQRIEKERKAVQAEAQMMNTIEYRVDCKLLQYLHYENGLGYRFPIGKMDQVQKWTRDELMGYWKKWYYPGNATLYVVGDFDRSIPELQQLIKDTFGKRPPGTIDSEQAAALMEQYKKAGPGFSPPYLSTLPEHLAREAQFDGYKKLSANGNGALKESNGAGNGVGSNGVGNGVLRKDRQPLRPPVIHNMGVGPMAPDEKPPVFGVFQHHLLHHFMLSLFCKTPLQPMTKMGQLRQMFMLRIVMSVFQFRVNKRYCEADPPFLGIQLDISDSGREGCAVSTLTIMSEPKDWDGATAVAIQEVRRLQRHGVTKGELERYTEAILRDSSQFAEQGNKVPSLDALNFAMETLACGSKVMDTPESHEAMVKLAATIQLEEVNALTRSALSFASDYGHEREMLADYEANPEKYAAPGPTRTTSIVACIPAFVDAEGVAAPAGVDPRSMRSSMGAGGHIDPDTIDMAALEAEAKELEQQANVPEGAVRFDVGAEDMARVMRERSYDVSAPEDIQVPKHLISPEQIEEKMSIYKPRYVPLGGEGAAGPIYPPAEHRDVVMRRLSNGVRLNYRLTDFEPKCAVFRIAFAGGRAWEKMGASPDGFGANTLGTRIIGESGAVGNWSRDVLDMFSLSHLINAGVDADEENIIIDCHVSSSKDSLRGMMEMVHLFIEEPLWDEASFERAKVSVLSSAKVLGKSLESASNERVLSAMMGPPEVRRLRDPTAEEMNALTLEGCKKQVRGLMHPGNMEVSIVGDFDAEYMEELILQYFGTLKPAEPQNIVPLDHVGVYLQSPAREQRHQWWHLKDSDERAVAIIAGGAPARWGPLDNYGPLPPLERPVKPPVRTPEYAPAEARSVALEERRKHPLFTSCVFMVLTEIMNSRLFTTVRDSLGLTYDVSFEFIMLDRVRTGWYAVQVTSHPNKIYEALDASMVTLRDLRINPVTRRELDRARLTTLSKHEVELKDNVYWLGLLTHLQADTVPYKTIECLRDLEDMYRALTVDDIYTVYNKMDMDDEHVFSCVGTSGEHAPPAPALDRPLGASFMDDEEGDLMGNEKMDPMALFTALMAASQANKMKQGLKKFQRNEQQG